MQTTESYDDISFIVIDLKQLVQNCPALAQS
ncbi:hypothetical protein BH23ACT4_BH23ACT4_11860 [soil metagenome]